MDDKAYAGDKDRKKRQSIGKSNRPATTSKEQPSHAFETKDPLSCTVFPKAWIANPCWCHWSIQGSPLSIWYQGRPWAAAHSVLVIGNNTWEFLSWNEKSLPSSTQEALSFTLMASVQSCPEKNAVEKRKINISFSVLECGCLQSWSIFAVYKKFHLDVPQVQFWWLENLLSYPDWPCIFREGYVSFGYKILIISCLLHKCGQLSYFPNLSLDPWEKQACF